MREILFRGKRVDNGSWVYGDFCKPCNIVWLEENKSLNDLEVFDEAVQEETLGQYTGLKDKNGTKIYDGDIIYYKEENMHGLINFRYGGWYITWYGYVQVSNGIGWEDVYTECNEESLYSNCLTEEDKIPYEIVGNVHDNPDLLEVADYEEY